MVAHGAVGSHHGQEERNRYKIEHIDESAELLATVVIEHRFSGGDRGRAREIASEFIKLGVDLILTGGTENVIATRRATSTIPIVFAVAGDPVGTGLVASLSRPGGNVTGLSVQAVDLAGKSPSFCVKCSRLHRFAILADTGHPRRLADA